MSSRVRHATIVKEQPLPVVAARAFLAWSSPEERRLWDVPGDGWIIADFEMEFRVGGREYSRFGPPERADNIASGWFLDIVEGERIVSAGTMHKGETRVSSTLCTVEFWAEGAGSRVRVTDQSAFYGPETEADRRSGWGEILSHLHSYLTKGGST